MSALPVEATEPDPAAVSLPNDETLNKPAGDPSAPTDKEAVMADAKETSDASVKVEAGLESEKNASDDTKAEGIKSEDTTNDGIKREEAASTAKDEKRSSREAGPEGMLRTRYKPVDGQNNSKYDPSILQKTDDPQKIRAQVEFYFGDTNLPTDKFMWEMTDGATNNPVPIEKICAFGRMKRFLPVSAVVAALKQSNFLDVIGEEGKEEVKRKIAFNPNIPRSKAESRTIYVKGFGDEEPSSQFDIEAFFASYGPTNAIRLRRTDNKMFKGSVFVEFQDEETADKFMALDPKPKWRGEHELMVKTKRDYMDGKAEDIKDGKIEPRNGTYAKDGTPGSSRGGRGNRGGYRGNNNRGGNRGNNRGNRGGHRDDRNDRDRGSREHNDRDPDDWKKRRQDDQENGFKNDRHNKRGGRGGNRGRGDRSRGDNNRNQERAEKKNNDTQAEGKEGKSEAPAPETNEKKRPREDNGVEEPPNKKVDTKPEVAVNGS